MDRISKLFKKISKKERKMLEILIWDIQDVQKRDILNIKKLKNSDFYRVRKSRFRIIFHIEESDVVVDSVTLRNEKTYKKI